MSTRKDSQIINLLLIVLMLIPLMAGSLATSPVAEETSEASYIVQAADMESAAAAVSAVGAEITHELAIIDAVGARLTPAEWAQLEALDGLRLFQGRSVEVSTTTSAALTVRDEFNSVSYEHNDGMTNWNTNWVETGDDGSPSGGDITVEVDDCLDSSSQCVEFDGDADQGATLERGVDLGWATLLPPPSPSIFGWTTMRPLFSRSLLTMERAGETPN